MVFKARYTLVSYSSNLQAGQNLGGATTAKVTTESATNASQPCNSAADLKVDTTKQKNAEQLRKNVLTSFLETQTKRHLAREITEFAGYGRHTHFGKEVVCLP